MARVEQTGPERMTFVGSTGPVIVAVLMVAGTWWFMGPSWAGELVIGLAFGMFAGWTMLGSQMAADGWVIATLKNAQGKRRYIVGKEEKPEAVERPKAVVRWL